MSKKKILLTGCAGFIGYHVALRLLERGELVVGIDSLNAYYEVQLKRDRLALLEKEKNFSFLQLPIEDRPRMDALFQEESFSSVVHLAAQAGVRYSLEDPYAYVDSNLVGLVNILEGCRLQNVDHLLFASSSSVYGANQYIPFSEHHGVDHPLSLYGASKKAGELMLHSYAHLFSFPCTALRFFTVYGPWGRPDMAPFLFTKAILEGEAIKVFNHGKMRRDFTYIDDIVEAIVRILDEPAKTNKKWSGKSPDPATSRAPYRVYNIGNHTPVGLMTFIETLEKLLGKKAKKNYLPMAAGDVVETYADVHDLERDFGFRPKTSLKEGLEKFVSWYKTYYGK